MSKHTLDIESVTHRYGDFTAVDDVTLSINAGEIVALLGPSGCGKTSLLRIVAGFVQQTQGVVRIDGRSIDDLHPNRRNVGIVFQSYALFPHMTVAQNVAFGLEARGAPRATIRKKVQACLDAVQLPHAADRFPKQLSGGQQQRVALARALAIEPSILLLDEPFGALDKNLRLDMQIEIKRLQRQLGLTAILVTHDQEEAMTMADRIAVMNRGRVEQLDTPVNVYDRPATAFVNGFIGTTNLFPARVLSSQGDLLRVGLDAGVELCLPRTQPFRTDDRVTVSVRPEQLTLSPSQQDGYWPVEVGMSLPMGATMVHEAWTIDRTAIKVTSPRRGDCTLFSGKQWCGLVPDARPSIFPA